MLRSRIRSFIFASARRSLTIRRVVAPLVWTRRVRVLQRGQGQAYAVAWGDARRRLYGEVGDIPCSGASSKRLRALKDAYKGNRIFIIGNGPSLNQTPLHLLENEFTFGTNRIYLLFNRITWRPTFYTVLDWRVGPDNADEINALGEQAMTFFFPQRFRGLLREGEDVHWYWSRKRGNTLEQQFAYDISGGLYGLGTITATAIQIACHLGFDPIYLIGCDSSYRIPSSVKQSGRDAFGDGVKLFLESTKDDDPNHFDPQYFGRGKRWHNPNVAGMREGYGICEQALERRGVAILNASVGGQLEVFRRVTYESLFSSFALGVPPHRPAGRSPDRDQQRVGLGPVASRARGPRRLRVAYDLRRWAEYWHLPHQTMGMTRYATSLYASLSERSEACRICPVLYASLKEPRQPEFSETVKAMEASSGTKIDVSWREANNSGSVVHRRVASIAHQMLGLAVSTRLAEVALSRERRQRFEAQYSRLLGYRKNRRGGTEPVAFRSGTFVGRDQWDLYHSPFHPLPPLRYTGRAIRIVTIADCIYLLRPDLSSNLGPPMIRTILNSIKVDRDYVICISEASRLEVLSFLPISPDRVRTVPLAHASLFNRPRLERAFDILGRHGVRPGKYVLGLGQVDRRKNTRRLAKAWTLLTARQGLFRDLDFVWVCHRRFRDRFTQHLKESDVPLSSFRILVDVDDETLASLYANAALFAFPSLHEGFGIPILEAMAAGCPVVTSDAAGIVEVAGDAPEYVTPDDVQSIARGIRRLLEIESLRNLRTELGAKRAARYSWQQTVDRTLEFYNHVYDQSVHGDKGPS